MTFDTVAALTVIGFALIQRIFRPWKGFGEDGRATARIGLKVHGGTPKGSAADPNRTVRYGGHS